MQSPSLRLLRDDLEPVGLLDAEAVLRWALDDPEWHTMVRALTRPPLATGRPEKYPLAAVVLLGMLVHELGSLHRVEIYLRRAWSWIRPELARHYDGYVGLELGDKPPGRMDYRRYLARHGISGDHLNTAFEDWAGQLAAHIHPADAPLGTMTSPHTADIIRADGVHLTPLFRSDRPDDVDPETGEVLRRRRRDPDAKEHRTGDGRKVTGVKFVVASRFYGSVNSTVILGIRAEGEKGEAATAVGMVTEVAEPHDGITAIAYDKAARGVHVDQWLKLGYLPLVRPFDHTKDKNPTPFIEVAKFRTKTGATIERPIYASEGTASLMATVNGLPQLAGLVTRKFSRNQNADGSFRAYIDLTVPDDPRLPADLVGSKTRIRADNTTDDIARGFNRAEHLRVHGPESDQFGRLMGTRSAAESTNKWLKRSLTDGRARGVGRDRQHADMILGAVYRNIVAALAARVDQSPSLDQAA